MQKKGRANEIIKASYISTVLNFLFTLIIDDRSTPALQTSFVLSLVKANFVPRLVDLLKFSWEKLAAPKEQNGDKALRDYWVVVERCLNICTLFCSSKMLLESPQTSNLTKEKDRASADFFDPGTHLVNMRIAIFPVSMELLNSPIAKTTDSTFVKSLIQILLHIFRAEGEASVRPSATSTIENMFSSRLPISSLSASLFGARVAPTVVSADPEKLQQLCDMGFPRSAAERALVQCNNNISRATDYILSHPELMVEPPAEATAADTAISLDVPATVATESGASEAAIQSLGESQDVEDSMEEDVDENSGDSDNEMNADESMKRTPDKDDIADSSKDAKSRKHELDALRLCEKDVLFEKAFDILLAVPDAIFEVKEFIFLLNQDVSKITGRVMHAMQNTDKTLDSHGRVLQAYLRFLALVTNDHKYQSTAIISLKPHISELIKMARLESLSESSITSLLLILESLISLTDEPASEDPTYKGSELKRGLISSLANENGSSATASVNESDKASENTVVSLEVNQKSSLLDAVFLHMKKTDLANDLHHACLRIFVRLTRSYDVASHFVQQGGLGLLFQVDRLGAFPAQQQLTLMILRHLLETPETLKNVFESEIKSWFLQNRPRSVDINSYLKNFSYLACRDPDALKAVTIKLCKLTKYDASGRHHSLTLKADADQSEDKKNGVLNKDITAALPVDVSMAESTSLAPKTNDIAHQVMRSMIADLLSTRGPSKGSEARDLHVNSNERSEISVKNLDSQHVPRCYLLQCLAELIISYPQCRQDVLNMSHKKAARTPSKNSTMKNALVSFLLSKLYPEEKKSPTGPQAESLSPEKKRMVVEGAWSAKILSGLCIEEVGDVGSLEKAGTTDGSTIRKVVLEAIAKNLKDAIGYSYEKIDDKYSRFLALASLVQQILNQKPSGAGLQRFHRVDRVAEEHSLQIAKMMLDKGYVSLLSNMISDLDVHHPSSKMLMSSLLVPVELLSRFAVKISRSTDDKENVDKDVNADTPATQSQIVEAEDQTVEAEDNGELSNIYRHSALSMFGPRTEPEEYEFSSGDEEGFEEFTDDDSMEDDSDMDDVGGFYYMFSIRVNLILLLGI